jgi:hypothetical protein
MAKQIVMLKITLLKWIFKHTVPTSYAAADIIAGAGSTVDSAADMSSGRWLCEKVDKPSCTVTRSSLPRKRRCQPKHFRLQMNQKRI